MLHDWRSAKTRHSLAYRDAEEARNDRLLLDECRVALGIATEAWHPGSERLRLALVGTEGWIAIRGGEDWRGYALRLYALPPAEWVEAKRSLSFAQVIRDDNNGGALRFDLPVEPYQAAVIRKLAGLPPELSPEAHEARRLRRRWGRTTPRQGRRGWAARHDTAEVPPRALF
jgi:hypothetical protein